MTTHEIRPATDADAAAVAEIWRQGWYEAHREHVPDALLAVRTPESFDVRARARVAETVVITVSGEVAGFVMVSGDLFDQVFVAPRFRGGTVASTLLTAVEERVRAAGHDSAWLAVVAANARARRFYGRQGWVDTGDFDNPAWTPDGPISVPSRRYVKTLS